MPHQDLETIRLIQSQSESLQSKEEALVFLYHQYVKLLYGYFYHKTNSKEDAEDLTSETFLEMVRNIDQYLGNSNFKNWLFGIAKFKLLAYLRGKYRHSTASLEDESQIPSHEQSFDLDEVENEQTHKNNETKLSDILNSLPPKYQNVLKLRFLENFSLKETADKLKISLSNAKVLQFRALKKANQISTQKL